MLQAPKTRVLVFILLTILLTLLVPLITNRLGPGNFPSLIIMWIPGLAALTAALITRRRFMEFGWKLSAKWLAAGWLIPIGYATVAYAIIWLTGIGGVPNPTFIERASFTLGMKTDPSGLLIAASFFYITVVNLLPAMLMSFGEELGWRGYLVPELSKWVGFKKAAWLSGIIWAAWHLPGIVSGNYTGIGTPLLFQITCFVLMVIATAVILAWLRLRSASVWPAVIFHATHNGAIQMFFNRITYDTGPTAYFTGEFGIGLALVTLIFAFYIYSRKSGEVTGTENDSRNV